MKLFQPIARLLMRFKAAQTGAAAVEFALILPIMLLVYVGTNEASTVITVDRKVQSVSGSLGDLVARTDTDLPIATLQDYVRVAGGIMTPFDATPLTQSVTQFFVATNGETAKVIWSKGFKGQAPDASLGYVKDSTHSLTISDAVLPAAMVAVAKGQYVIVAEASYTYKPFYGFGFNKDIALNRRNFYLPRFGGQIALK